MAGTETAKNSVTACEHCGGTEFLDLPKFDTNGEVLRIKRTCRGCGRYIKFVPKREAGYDTRSVSKRSGINPKRRKDVMERDGFRCVLCGQDAFDVNLHLSHIISVHEGYMYGIDESMLNSTDNLVTLCEECNLGFGRESIPLPQVIRLFHKRRLRGYS